MPNVKFTSEGLGSGPHNMARDVELLTAGKPACRLYRWEGPWVSLGRFQTAEEAVLPGFKNVVLRPTGGKAVLHGHDQTVALVLPFFGRSVRAAYLAALQPLLEALEACGAHPNLGTSTSTSSSEDCFATTSPYDLTHRVTGAKIAGVAMRINRTTLLLQASIPYKPPLIDPKRVIQGASVDNVLHWEWQSFEAALKNTFSAPIPQKDEIPRPTRLS